MGDELVPSDGLVFPDDFGKPVTTSLVVAEKFGKRHADVLRDIRRIVERTPDRASNFAQTVQERPNPSGGEPIRSTFCRITRDGFIKLANGFTGEAADKWQWRFIDAFNAMEASAQATGHALGEVMASVGRAIESNADTLRQARAMTDARIGDMDARMCRGFNELGEKVDQLHVQVANFAHEQSKHRRNVNAETKARHRVVLALQGWACPCCRKPQPTTGFEFDHFFTNSHADFEHTWPLCPPCHRALTWGQIGRADVRSDFDAYQAFAKRELPEQRKLF